MILLESASRFMPNYLANDLVKRLRGADDPLVADLASPASVLVPFLFSIVAGLASLALGIWHRWNRSTLTLIEAWSILVAIVLAFAIGALLLRTSLFGIVCFSFGGILNNSGTMVAAAILVAEIAKNVRYSVVVILLVAVLSVLCTNSLYGTHMIGLLAGRSFFNRALEACSPMLPSDANQRYQYDNREHIMRSLTHLMGSLFVIAFALAIAVRKVDAMWISAMQLQAGNIRMRMEKRGRLWALKTASRVLPIYFVEYLFGVLNMSSATLAEGNDNLVHGHTGRPTPAPAPVIGVETAPAQALRVFGGMPPVTSVSRVLGIDAESSYLATRSRILHVNDVALVAIRLSGLSLVGPIAGPRAIYSQLRGLGKTVEGVCQQVGGRRVRLLDDGLILGFGLEQTDDTRLR